MTATFDFDKSFASTAVHDHGAEIEIRNDAGQPTGFFITLAGPDGETRKRTRARLTEFLMRNGMIAGQQATAAENVSAADFTGSRAEALFELQLADLVAATIAWRYPDGFNGPECNAKEARALYTRFPSILKQVMDGANKTDRFSPAS